MAKVKATFKGTCVDIGNNNRMSDFFSDATALEYSLENHVTKINRQEFLAMVNVPKKINPTDSWEFGYFRSNPSPEEYYLSRLFYAYNPTNDIHYFFDR